MNTESKNTNAAPELLMPAGDLEKLKYALAFGGDAVYLGVPYFSLRARENEFNLENLRTGIEHAHSLGKKVYVTANIFGHNRKINSFIPSLREWLSAKPDALIMSDPGLMMMAREEFPDAEIHLSVQANCMNWQTVKFWNKSLNVKRVILSRELSLNEIKEIHERVPDIELEAFVHGAICIAYSGRCLLSSYMSNRDANQGVCDNTCREKFKVHIEDTRDPGKKYEIQEDEEGTYILNSKDLCVISRLQELKEAGVCSFKVEGRTKSVYYVSSVARAYRKAIDDMMAGKPFDPSLLAELEKISNRGYHAGFFNGTPGAEGQNYSQTTRFSTRKFAGLAQGEMNPEGYLPVEIRGTIKTGMEIELLGPDMQQFNFKVGSILNYKKQPADAAHPGTGVNYIKPEGSLNFSKEISNNGILNVIM